MERRSFLKMFSGALAAIPLFKFLPNKIQERCGHFVGCGHALPVRHADIGRIDMLNMKHWGLHYDQDGQLHSMDLDMQAAWENVGIKVDLGRGTATVHDFNEDGSVKEELSGGRHV